MDAAIFIVTLVSVLFAIVVGTHSMRTSERSAQAAARSARIAQEQLEAMLEAQRAAMLPYVWADIRMRDDAGMLTLVIGNSGPTVATDVVVTFEPALTSIIDPRSTRQVERAAAAEKRCASGLGSLAPGRTSQWSLDVLHKHFPEGGAEPVPSIELRIDALGPESTPLPQLTYVIDLEDLKHQDARPQGLALLEKPLHRILEALKLSQR